MMEAAGFAPSARRLSADIASTIASPWPSTAEPSRGARCWTRGARTGGSCARRTKGARARAQLVELPARAAPATCSRALQRARHRAPVPHQAQALHAAWAGPTIVTTGTASGKSLCFNLPTLDVLCRDAARARAVPVSDQGARPGPGARAGRVRADQARAPRDLRRRHAARGARARSASSANVVLTNPDMLHVGILPNHAAWAELFANLAVVVIDEAHVYRGVFGSHVANVLRRLRRIAAAYGTQPRFLLTSATIANPVELAERLTGPRGRRADRRATARRRRAGGSPIWNPPLTDEALGTRRSALAEAAELLARLVARRRAHDLLHEVAQGRRAAEPPRQATSSQDDAAPSSAELVEPYRAGYTAAAAARARAPARARGAARGDHDRRARARHRHRRARRGGRRDLPGHGRVAAPDVGPRRAARARAGACTSPARTRSTSSSAATPTSSSTAPSRRRSSTTRAR